MDNYEININGLIIRGADLDYIKSVCFESNIDESNIKTIQIDTTIYTDLKTPRLKKLQIDKDKDHRAVDWNTELLVTLETEYEYARGVSERGLLKSKTYLHNSEKILKISYDYILNIIGNIEQQEINISWYNEDDTINDLKKEKGFVVFSQDESKKASYKRRESIISMLEADIESMVKAGASTEAEVIAGIEMAKQLLSDVSTEVSIFKTSSDSTPLINKLASITTTYPILNGYVAPNVTVLMYIADFLTY